MRNLFRATALGAVALAALAGAVVPAGANTLVRDATFSHDEYLGGSEWYRLTASATYAASGSGAATVECNAVALNTRRQTVATWCALYDPATSDHWEAPNLPWFQSSYNVGAFVINGERTRLQLCAYIYDGAGRTWATPQRCVTLT